MILDTKLTLFAKCTDTIPRSHPTLAKILESIRNPTARVAHAVAECRAEPDKARRRKIKSALPAVCFGAELNHRRGDDPTGQVLRTTGIMCLDFDALPNVGDSQRELARDRHVIAAFRSPSGDGLKVLVPILGDFRDSFRAASSWYTLAYNLAPDEARKDLTGLCYASHDPELYLAADPDACEPFKILPKADEPFLRFEGDVLSEYLDYQAAKDPLMMINPDCAYHQWIEVGQGIHCQFGGSHEGLALFDEWSKHGSKYQGGEDTERHYRSFRSAGITFRTVLKYAGDAGWCRPGRPKKIVQPSRPAQTADELGELITAQVSGSYAVAPLPFPMLTSKGRSLMPGSVTLLCGAPGSAKSWFILTCLRYWVTEGHDAEVLMLEEGKGWHLNRLLAHLCEDVRVLDPDWVRANGDLVHSWHQRHKETISKVGAHLHCDGNVTLEACCEWVEKQCEAGKRIIVIDPITLADPGNQKTWDADRRFMARCKVAIERSGTSLLLVSHPKKGGNNSGKPMPPTMDDLAGGAAFTRAAASVLWMCGVTEPTPTNILDHQAVVQQRTPHKLVRILKARNSTGQNETIAFSFGGLQLIELGIVSTAKAPEPVRHVPQDKTAHGRMNATPSPSEDVF